MRTLSSLKYHAVHVMLANLFLLQLISPTSGSFDTVSEAMCEYEDANLIWRNTPAYSLHDVKAMAWYKGKGSLIATWLEEKGFVEYPPYICRLMQIGESGIKIKKANRSDSGTYWLSLTLASVDHKLEAATHLEVKVAPLNQCKPRITQEGSILKADLPYEGCGTPHLTTKWKHTNKTVIQGNSSSLLDLGSNPEPGEYMVCAEGESAKCYQGNISDLCTKYITTYNVRHPHSDHRSTPDVVTIILVVIALLVVFVLALVFVVMRIRQEVKDRKSREKLLGIQNHLMKLYESLMNVPLSPNGDGDHVNVSEVYTNIDIGKVEFTDLDNGKKDSSSDTPRDGEPLFTKDQAATKQKNKFGPIFMFGDCGSGKSTWCKHLVKCWLQNSDIKLPNIQGLNLPNLRNIKILLYLPLQFSDRGLSFQELLKEHLFKENPPYLKFLMKHVQNYAQDVLVVMDGLDIISQNVKLISELLRDKLISSCTVIVTSRPASLKLLQDTCHDKIEQLRLFRVSEMTPEGSKEYANKLLKSINRLHVKNLKFENFWRFTEHLQVHSLLKVPYICLLLLHVWMENKNVLIEVTDILLHIIKYYLCRAMMDHQRKELIEKAFGRNSVDVKKYITKLNKWPLLMQNEYLLHVLSGIAAEIFSSEIERKTSKLKIPERFSIPDEDGLELQVICETGLLTESLSLSTNKKVSNLSFSDRIICEFFVSIFIALHEGKECDFIVSSGNSSLQNSMIIHMLFQLSDTNTVVRDIMEKASKSLEEESRNTVDNEGHNEKFRYSITQKSSCNDARPVLWLQWLMYNDMLDENKLLFLTTALHCIDTLTSLVLENQENNENLVFWLPVLSMLETLTLNINKCTLLLCKDWYNRVPQKLQEVAIKSVNINICTLGLLTKALGLCADLERLELFPSAICTDHNHILPDTSDLANYSWNGLSESIQKNKKLKNLKLQNLVLYGEVDSFLSRLNHYENLETLNLGNLSNIFQNKSSLSHSPDTARCKNNDSTLKNKIKLTQLKLEKLNISYSPISFLFGTEKKNKTNPLNNNLKVLFISALQMPEKAWETLGNQISTLTLSEFHLSSVNPRDSLKGLLEGIGKCTKLTSLSLCKIETGKITSYFSFITKMKELLQLHLERMKIPGPSSCVLFRGICECKKLQTLSLCNIDIEKIPETLSSVHKLTKLSKLTVDKVTIKEGSGSLIDFLNAFSKCENLKTLYLLNVKEASISSQLLASTKWTIITK